ncbi:MAG: alkaline phosphatase family protein [Actinomycetota bacterium]
MNPTAPDYAGACVSNIVPAILGSSSRSWLPAPARDASQIVLLVLDGLGWSELRKRRPPVLSSMEGGSITTVVPSTTATVLTSITTGAPSAEHGIVALRMLVGDVSLHVLKWLAFGGDAPDPEKLQTVKPFLGTPVPIVTRSSYQRSGFTVAHLRGARYFGWYTTSTLVERVRRLVRDGERFVYAYYDGVDHLAHVRGLNDGFYEAELAFADRLVGEMMAVLPADAALIVTADHGQVDLPVGSWMQLPGDVLARVREQSGEARFRFLYSDDPASLLAACREQLGDAAWVFSRDELIESRLLGPKAPRPEVAARLGDVVLAARAPVGFIDPAFPEEVRLRSAHGSLTEAEMIVPLLGARGLSP